MHTHMPAELLCMEIGREKFILAVGKYYFTGLYFQSRKTRDLPVERKTCTDKIGTLAWF